MVARHPAASEHLPIFLPSADGSDPLMTVTAVILIVVVLLIGVVFFRLHALPEQFGHKKLQYEVVAVLALISLFTHIHLFWVIALVLAMVDLPDFTTPLQRIATALERRPSVPSKSAMQVQSDQALQVPRGDETRPAPTKELVALHGSNAP